MVNQWARKRNAEITWNQSPFTPERLPALLLALCFLTDDAESRSTQATVTMPVQLRPSTSLSHGLSGRDGPQSGEKTMRLWQLTLAYGVAVTHVYQFQFLSKKGAPSGR